MSLIVYSNTGYHSDTIMSIVLHIAMPITPSWSSLSIRQYCNILRKNIKTLFQKISAAEPSSYKIEQTDLIGLRQLAEKVQGIHQLHNRLGHLGTLSEIIL